MTTAGFDPPDDRPGVSAPEQQETVSVSDYYRDKTAAIIDRYGPGPRVHYHIGLFDEPCIQVAIAAERIRARMVAAQERMLERVATVCEASAVFSGDLLDVGCGLGGGSIYWAQRFPVGVTALTNVPEHAPVISSFAAQAGVAAQVHPLVMDVLALPPTRRFSAAIAIESACYAPRPQLFQRVGATLAPGGVFAVEDIFLAKPVWREPFDEYWRTRIGTLPEYARAAEQAGFVMDRELDVTADTTEFWIQSMAWSHARLAEPTICAEEEDRLTRSIRWHTRFFLGWREKAYHACILRFRKVR